MAAQGRIDQLLQSRTKAAFEFQDACTALMHSAKTDTETIAAASVTTLDRSALLLTLGACMALLLGVCVSVLMTRGITLAAGQGRRIGRAGGPGRPVGQVGNQVPGRDSPTRPITESDDAEPGRHRAHLQPHRPGGLPAKSGYCRTRTRWVKLCSRCSAACASAPTSPT